MSYKHKIAQQAVVCKETSERQLTDFQKAVNDAAIQLCLADVSLVGRRGDLLNAARKFQMMSTCSRRVIHGPRFMVYPTLQVHQKDPSVIRI